MRIMKKVLVFRHKHTHHDFTMSMNATTEELINQPDLSLGCCTASTLHAGYFEDVEPAEVLARYAKAIGHPTRVKILAMLNLEQSCFCGSLVEKLELPQSTVSQHLRVLKDAGLIKGEIAGKNTCYCVDETGLRHLRVLVANV